jgi:hypothetical protein
MMMGAFSVFHLVVLFGMMGPAGVPPLPETPTLSRIAPEECLFYMSSAGRAEPQASSQNQTEQLLAEPEVQKFAAEVEAILKSLLDRGLAQPGAPPLTSDEIASLAKTLLCRPMAVYVGSVEVQPSGPDVRGGAVVHLGNSAPQFKALMEKIAGLAPPGAVVAVQDGKDTWQTFKPDPKATFTWGFKGEYFMVAVGEGEMQALVKRAFGKAPAWLVELRQNAGVERISSIGYLNVKSILQIAAPQMPPNAPKIIEALGIANLKHVSVVAGLDKTGFVSKTTLALDGLAQGLLKFADAKPLSAADLAPIPADAVSAAVYRLDAEAIFDAVLNIADRADPRAKGEMQAAIAEWEARLGGVRLREEILQPLGDTICAFNSPKEGGPIGGTVVVSLKNAEQAKATNAKLFQIAQSISQANSSGPKFTKTDFNGMEIFGVQMSGVPGAPSPNWCITDKALVVGMTWDKLKAYLSRGADFQSLAQSPEIARTLEGGSGPLALIYLDSKQMFDGIYASLPMLLAMATPAMKQQGINFNASMLPSAGSIRPHLLPLVITVRKTSSGIEFSERSSLPMSIVMSPANPVAIALILPAVQAAREAARRARSTNNLKQISLGILNYESVGNALPPAFKADKNGKPLLSWRVLILPYIEENGLYEQFHLDEPWDSEHNKKLLDKMPDVYKNPNSRVSAEGKTNYLTVRGAKTIFSGGRGTKIRDISDGSSNTITVVEVNDESAVPWTKPDDFEYDENDPIKGLVGMRPGIFLAAFADGHVQAISQSIDANVLKALFTRDGGEAVQLP